MYESRLDLSRRSPILSEALVVQPIDLVCVHL